MAPVHLELCQDVAQISNTFTNTEVYDFLHFSIGKEYYTTCMDDKCTGVIYSRIFSQQKLEHLEHCQSD